MTLTSFKKLATVSAIALGITAYSGAANAAAYEMDLDTVTVNVTAAVDNTADLVTTPVAFQTIGVTSDAVDTATLVMDTTGAITDDIAAGAGLNEAHIVSDDNTGAPGTATLTAALPNTQVFVYYTNLVDLTDGVAAPDLILEGISDDLATPGSFTATGNVQVVGVGTTDGTGELVWNIGASISTQATADQYNTGTYTGSFDIYLTY